MKHWFYALSLVVVAFGLSTSARATADDSTTGDLGLFRYLAGAEASLIAYTPSRLDPRNPANQGQLPTSEIRADLESLRPHFDGLVLYGYHEACTPRIVALARDLQYRALLLAVWDPKSAAEVDGVVALAGQFSGDLACGVIVGNEGLTFGRYEEDDVQFAADRLRRILTPAVPITTSEPLSGYEREFVRSFGDFLAPNIHPVFDRPALSAAEAAAWVRAEAAQLARQTGKPVLVKETGFPHAGRHTGTPEYTPALQREFWSEYLARGRRTTQDLPRGLWVFQGVAFEAFDLPWRAAASGLPIERSWGLFDPQRQPYPAAEVFATSRPSR
jgi:exo-beta-1,3-glucanase (GH17 family)